MRPSRHLAHIVVVALAALAAGAVGPAGPARAATGSFTQPGTVAVPDQFAAPQNLTTITVGDNSTATPYESTVTTSGLDGTIADVDVQLFDLSHTWPDDIDVMLVGPNGARVVLMSDAGGEQDVSNVDLTLDDDVVFALPDEEEALLSTDRWRPANYAGDDIFPAPAPDAAGAGSSLSAFDGANPNGLWRLYVQDDAGGDIGDIGGGFRLILQLAPAATPYPSNLQVSGLPKGVTDVNLTLHGLTHTLAADLDLMLVGPQGQRTLVMSDAGAGAAGVTVTLDDDLGLLVPETPTDIVSGTYRPTNYNYPGQPGDNFQPPAPSLPLTAANLGVFDGTDPNGTWSLYAVDDAIGDTGGLAGGWSLQITTVDPPQTPSLLTPADRTVDTDGVLTFTGTAAPGVVVRVLDAGTEVASTATTSGGSYSVSLAGVGNGAHSYRAAVTDSFGNTSTSSPTTVTVDATAPTGTVSINGGAARTRSTSVALALSSTDAGTGVSRMRFSNDGSTWSAFEAYAASRIWSLTTVNGTKTVWVQYADAAGNISGAAADSIVLDTVEPKVSVTSPARGATGVRRGKTVKASLSEVVVAATVSRTTAYLTKVGSTVRVRARVRYDAGTRKVIINPRGDLAAGTAYTVTITTGVTDLAGNSLDQKARAGLQPKRWRFTTR